MINDVDILVLSISDSDLFQSLLLNVYNEKSQKDNSNEYTVKRKLIQLQLSARAIVCEDFNAHHL